MGADLIAASLLLPKHVQPDWDAASAHLTNTPTEAMALDPWDQAFSLTEYFEWHDDPDTPESRHEILTLALDTVKRMYVERWRNTALHQHAHTQVWILGETSWGDNPEGWWEFTMFCETPLYLAAGFEPIYRKDAA